MSDGNDEEVPAALRRKRRSWSLEEKRGIVDKSLEDGASLAEVARRHDLNANQLFAWRRQFGVEPAEPKDLAPILPVTITPETAPAESDPGPRGQMEIVLAEGDRILVWSDVETAALTRVLKALSRR
jgi:transposase